MGEIERMELVGGHVAIDFVNTLGGPHTGAPDDEYLCGYTDLVRWAERTGLLEDADARRLETLAAQHVGRAAEILDHARRLRAGVDAVLRAEEAGRPPDEQDLRGIHTTYVAALGHARLDRGGDGYEWSWPEGDDALARPLWPVAAQAVALLRDGPLDRLAQCGNCRWLFLDLSRNHSRRWCSMNSCGAVMKMRRYRARQRA